MNKFKLRVTELLLILAIGIVTLITTLELPLLGIPFVIIIMMRSVFATLEDSSSYGNNINTITREVNKK